MSHLTCVICNKRLDFRFEDFFTTVIEHMRENKEEAMNHRAAYMEFADWVSKYVKDCKFIDEMYVN